MHVLQYVAVKSTKPDDDLSDVADMKEEAHRSVDSRFEGMYSESEGLGGWSDWYVVGGGRFTEGDPYSDDKYTNTISYAEKPEEFKAAIDTMITSRKEEFARYRKSFNDKNIDINAYLDKYDGVMDYSFDLYELNKCIDMLQGQWDMNAYFFDLENFSTNPKWCLENLDIDPNSWYLVPVDFHF